ncbi:hypothetical protein EBS02_12065, partial [bacterium]|nr:hypothetical protein [bacterium]
PEGDSRSDEKGGQHRTARTMQEESGESSEALRDNEVVHHPGVRLDFLHAGEETRLHRGQDVPI